MSRITQKRVVINSYFHCGTMNTNDYGRGYVRGGNNDGRAYALCVAFLDWLDYVFETIVDQFNSLSMFVTLLVY